MKRAKLIVPILLVALVLLQGGAMAQEPVTIELWHSWTGAWTQVIDDIVAGFEAHHPGIKVDALVVPGGERDTKLMAAIAAGNPPDILFTMGNLTSYAARGAMIAIEDLMTPEQLAAYKEYQYPLWTANVYDDKLWSFHGFVDIMGLYYNKNHFREVGLDPEAPPRDIATLDEYAKKLTTFTSGRQFERAGFLPDNLFQWANVFGGTWLDNGQISANHPKNIAAGEWLASYSQEFDVRTIVAFNSSLATERAQALDPFISERFAMQLMGQWKVLDIARYADPDFDYGVVPLPAPPGGRQNAMIVPSGYGLIPKGARHPQEALKYLLYWVGKGFEEDRANIFTMGGWFPLADAVTEQPVYQDYIAQYPELGVFRDILREAEPTGFATPVELFYMDRINAAMDRMRLLQGTPESILDQVQREVAAELANLQ